MKSLHTFLFLAICLMPLHAAEIPPHPRLLVTDSDWENLPARMEARPEVAAVIKACIARADAALNAGNLTYELKGRRMLAVSRHAVGRVLDLSTAWKATGDRRYFERCRSELLSLCAFKDWHPEHHLDTAEMQTAIAIGYDWLHADLSETDRKTIAAALLEKGLKTTFADKRVVSRDNNWNQVCNGGMVLSAIALLDVAPELALSALEEARANIPIALKAGYPPDGAYSEGPGYWGYGTIYSILTAEALRTAGLPGAGITEHPGFMESGKYVALAYGNSGLMFNYGDNRESTRNASASIAWMAKQNQSAAIWDDFGDGFLKIDPKRAESFLALAAFWIPDPDEPKTGDLPLHFAGTGKSPIAIHRTGFCEKDLFLGIKAGKANVNHGHMDAGSFVLDSMGHRWVSDLGHQDYHSLEQTGMDLFEMTPQSRRWTVFRLNQSSHNTLTYNRRPHDINGAAKILSSIGAPGNETVLDMSAPLGLPEGATAIRSFGIDGHHTVTVTDTISGLRSGDTIDWHMMTRAKAKPDQEGYQLSMGGENLDLTLSSDQATGISAADANPPPSGFDEENPGFTRILYRTRAGTDGKVVIRALFQ
jgi:hypothetical protein